jgi:ribonuclease J
MAKAKHVAQDLVFCPLGGSGEIGMNLNLYGFGPPDDREWIMCDLGVTFGNLSTPGVEVIMPDPEFIVGERHKLRAIILTHAHEDHMGAVARLWPKLQVPIYATPFTMYLVRDRLAEVDLLGDVELHEIDLNSRFKLGAFDVELVTITHSIPEPNGLIIRTPLGTVLHTGDWKIDPDPVIGETTDDARLRKVGDEGVLAMICDSTNVFTPGEAGSEADVRAALIAEVAKCKGKVAIAAFASNVARLDSAIQAAQENDRRVCLVGRSMHRMTDAAKSVGLLGHAHDFIDESEAGHFPDDKILFLCTGSQGEPRAALSRIAAGTHRHVSLGEGDSVLFSSRVIPGNELGIFALQNTLADRGVHIVTEKSAPIHVSGHPCRDELKQMYAWAKPTIAIPVHGERRHLLEHADYARSLGIKQAVPPMNGDLIRLAPGPAQVIDQVPAGRLHQDGPVIVDQDDFALKDRKRMAYNGAVLVALVLNDENEIEDGPDIRLVGVPFGQGHREDKIIDRLADAVEDVVGPATHKGDDDDVEKAVVRTILRQMKGLYDRRPLVEVSILRA